LPHQLDEYGATRIPAAHLTRNKGKGLCAFPGLFASRGPACVGGDPEKTGEA